MGFNDVNVNRIYPLIFQRSELENDLFFKGKSPCLSYKWAIFCGYVKSSEGKHGFVEMVMLDFSNVSTFWGISAKRIQKIFVDLGG